jgi:hypothetical protein
MCVVSMIGDHYHDKWKDFDWEWWRKQQENQNPISPLPGTSPYNPMNPTPQPFPFEEKPNIGRWEFEQLRKEVEEMKQLLIKALDYDKRNNEPDCQIEDKLETLRRIAAEVGINLDDILGPKKEEEK